MNERDTPLKLCVLCKPVCCKCKAPEHKLRKHILSSLFVVVYLCLAPAALGIHSVVICFFYKVFYLCFVCSEAFLSKKRLFYTVFIAFQRGCGFNKQQLGLEKSQEDQLSELQ